MQLLDSNFTHLKAFGKHFNKIQASDDEIAKANRVHKRSR
jgi:hypothetical protein